MPALSHFRRCSSEARRWHSQPAVPARQVGLSATTIIRLPLTFSAAPRTRIPTSVSVITGQRSIRRSTRRNSAGTRSRSISSPTTSQESISKRFSRRSVPATMPTSSICRPRMSSPMPLRDTSLISQAMSKQTRRSLSSSRASGPSRLHSMQRRVRAVTVRMLPALSLTGRTLSTRHRASRRASTVFPRTTPTSRSATTRTTSPTR